jgi:hypothetical protein
MSTLRSLSKSVRLWVLAKTDTKGVRTYYNMSRNEWHVDLKFADLVEYDRGVIWREAADIIAHDVELLPVTLTVEEN